MVTSRSRYLLLLLMTVSISFDQKIAAQKTSITTIFSFNEVEQIFKSCTKKSLVFFDIDNTLISSPDVLPRTHPYPEDFLTKLYLKYPSFILPKTWDYFFSFMWYHEPRLIIEKEIIAIIDDLKKRQIPVLGFTALETGSLGIIPNMIVWRDEMLTNMGIIFSDTYQHKIFTNFPVLNDNYPQLYKGIIYTNTLKKGLVLSHILQYLKIMPDEIILFDDNISQLESVE